MSLFVFQRYYFRVKLHICIKNKLSRSVHYSFIYFFYYELLQFVIAMSLSKTLLKCLSVLIIISFIYSIYFIIKYKSALLLTDENNYRYEAKGGSFNAQAEQIFKPTNIKVIPMPYSVQLGLSSLVISFDTFYITYQQNPTDDLQSIINRFSKYISVQLAFKTSYVQGLAPAPNNLFIEYSPSPMNQEKYPTLDEDESYILITNRTGNFLGIGSLTGATRGLATFLQLIEQDKSSGKTYIPFVDIVDEPRFPWRGLMLDVCRHWLSLPVIERTLDAMELSKLNVLHLHLSDDQGFRAESIQYPLLHDRKNFFSQKELRHIVEFARQRRIRVVPEFDIPGHTTSWFVGYPDLATVNMTYEVGIRWGVMKATMDPTKESTYTFLDGFFKEMTDIFPDPYFHIGGDEVEGSQWMQSPTIQKFINEHNLMNKNGLQAFFNRRIQTMLKKYNRTMIGWEEITHETSQTLSIDKDAVIQTWLNRKSLQQNLQAGFHGIMSNGYYLDNLQSSLDHYNTDPIRDNELHSLQETQQQRMLGGEMCMWTEYVSENSIDSRLWPRSFAIGERFWSLSTSTNQKSLYERLFRMNHLVTKMPIGLNHISFYRQRLENLIPDLNLRTTFLHPFTILADVCEPQGIGDRSSTNKYTALVPLNTFTDALQTESELTWTLENLPSNDQRLHETFRLWFVNNVHLQKLFESNEQKKYRELWGQDIEQLSKNLAYVGQIGLRVLNYFDKKMFHQDQNNTMNTWTLEHWIQHHKSLLNELEISVREVKLAAVRPVRRLLDSINMKN